MKLQPARIVEEALLILNEEGLDKLTTRLLATRLEVKQPALYWHFRNKRALLDAMNSAMFANGHNYRLPRPGDDWKTFLSRYARSFRNALLAYRDGARVHAGAKTDPSTFPEIEAQLRILVDVGISQTLALQTVVALSRFIVGSVLQQQAEETDPVDLDLLEAQQSDFPYLAAAASRFRQLSYDDLFEAGLSMFLAGLEHHRGQPAAA